MFINGVAIIHMIFFYIIMFYCAPNIYSEIKR